MPFSRPRSMSAALAASISALSASTSAAAASMATVRSCADA